MGKSLKELLAAKKAVPDKIKQSDSSSTFRGVKSNDEAVSETVTSDPPSDIAISDTAVFANEFNDDDQIDEFMHEKVRQLDKGLQFLANQIEHKGEVGEILKNLMMMMHETPELADIMQPKDIGLMVKALQESYGKVVLKKNVRSEKKKKNEESVNEIAGLLGDISINI